MDKRREMRATLLLLLTSAIWGLAFVAQKVGAEYVRPFTFNGIRFMLGALVLLPVIWTIRKKTTQNHKMNQGTKGIWLWALLAGTVLFLASGIQQFGLMYTSASNAGFITGLYIVLVPIAGIFLRQKTRVNTWIGVVLAVIGLYLLSIKDGFVMEFGDLLVLCCAIFFTVHILVIDYVTKHFDSLVLSCIQFFTCSILNLIFALFFENNAVQGIGKAAIPILYGGLFSVGVAYTLQVVAQKDAKPSHACIVMSMESVFSCIGGILILSERLSIRGVFGCILILTAILVSQIEFPKKVLLQ